MANFNANGDPITVNATLTTAATQASVALAQATATTDSTIEIIGNGGAATVKVGSGQNVLDAINSVSDVTGVIATGSSTVYLNSTAFGSDAFVTVNNVAGGLISGLTATDEGSDVAGSINGQAFSGQGLKAILKTANLDLELSFGQVLPPTPRRASRSKAVVRSSSLVSSSTPPTRSTLVWSRSRPPASATSMSTTQAPDRIGHWPAWSPVVRTL